MLSSIASSRRRLHALRFRRQVGHHTPPTKAASIASLLVKYSIKATGGEEIIFEVDSEFEIPHGIQTAHIPASDAASVELFQLLVAKPYATAVRTFLQNKYEASRAAEKTKKTSDRYAWSRPEDLTGDALRKASESAQADLIPGDHQTTSS